jgi:exonuclease VII large subunit
MEKLYGDQIRKEAGLTKTLRNAAQKLPNKLPKNIQREVTKFLHEQQTELDDTEIKLENKINDTINRIEKAIFGNESSSDSSSDSEKGRFIKGIFKHNWSIYTHSTSQTKHQTTRIPVAALDYIQSNLNTIVIMLANTKIHLQLVNLSKLNGLLLKHTNQRTGLVFTKSLQIHIVEKQALDPTENGFG